MKRDHIVILGNDVVPKMAMPAAAPGLRAWGLAQGLRAHGYHVTVVVDRNVVRRVWKRAIPPARGQDTILASPREIGPLVRQRRTKALVVTNSNHVDAVGDRKGTPLIYDFFAPKVLELQQDSSECGEEIVNALRERKLRALSQASAVIVNGAKKTGYVKQWLEMAGNGNAPSVVVNLPIDTIESAPPETGPIHAVVSGYIQPWSRPGDWAQAVAPYLSEGSMILHLLIGNHWGSRKAAPELHETFAELAKLPGVQRHGVMEYCAFRRFLARCHLSIDLFERNPERELAFVTRTAVSLATGVPAIHVPFTEVSELIRSRNAGWLVNSEDLHGISAAIEEAVHCPSILASKRDGALGVAADLSPSKAVMPLIDLLEALP